MKKTITLPLLALSMIAANSIEAKKTNIIFVLGDDYGCGEHSIYGNEILETPNIDRLATESVRFENFYVGPTSSPTRAQLMTGKHEFRVGVTHTIFPRNRVNPTEKLLPQILTENGYTTGHFGKWHLSEDTIDDEFSARKKGFDYSIVSNYKEHFDPELLVNGTKEPFKGFRTDILFSEAQKWISTQLSEDKAFFCYISLNSAHAPYGCPPEYEEKFIGHKGLKAEKSEKYYAMVENIDYNVGKLTDFMKQKGIYENTILVYMTDNGHLGPEFNAGMRGAKNSSWRGGSRVPCFFHCPDKFDGGTQVNELAGGIDFLPTILELCDINEKKGIDGISLVPSLKNSKKVYQERFMVSHTGRWVSGKADEGKYVKYAVQNKRYRLVDNQFLYDIETDPGEKTNIIDKHPELVKQMRDWYEKWWEVTRPLMSNEEEAYIKTQEREKVLAAKKAKAEAAKQ